MTSTEKRPPTILSPHGEGYCRYCRFIVGLDQFGLMDHHVRTGDRSWDTPAPCEGSCRPPAKRTPYMSKKSVFKTVGKPVACFRCGHEVRLSPAGIYPPHSDIDGGAVARPTMACSGSYHYHGQRPSEPRPLVSLSHEGSRPQACTWSCLVDGVNYPECSIHGHRVRFTQ